MRHYGLWVNQYLFYIQAFIFFFNSMLINLPKCQLWREMLFEEMGHCAEVCMICPLQRLSFILTLLWVIAVLKPELSFFVRHLMKQMCNGSSFRFSNALYNLIDACWLWGFVHNLCPIQKKERKKNNTCFYTSIENHCFEWPIALCKFGQKYMNMLLTIHFYLFQFYLFMVL